MSKTRSIAISVTLGLIAFHLLGCGLVYESRRKDMLATAKFEDYGVPPPANHCEIEAQMIRASLKDPGSAQFEWGEVTRDAIQSGFASPTPILIWRSDVRVNAKNSFGGYVGFAPYHFAWRGEHVIAVAYPLQFASGPAQGSWRYLD